MRALIIGLLLSSMGLPIPSAQSATLVLRSKPQHLHLYGPENGPAVLLSSGDLGWAGLVAHVAELLADKGYFVVGVDTRAYLSSFTGGTSSLSPQDVKSDYRVLVQFCRKRAVPLPILVGISEGAGLSVLAASAPDARRYIRGILGFGLPNENELGWKWRDFTIWLTKKVPNEPIFKVEDFIAQVSPIPLAEIHSLHDEFVSIDQARLLFSIAAIPKRMWVIDAANHRFSNKREELDRRTIEALEWIQQNSQAGQ
ncbi:MAG: alpha/beta hydrolase [Acidobacteriota bacterium]